MKMNKVVSGILLYGFIGLGAVISLFPFYWLAVMATNSSAAFMRFPPVMVFGGQFMTNMTNLLNSIQFGRAMFNTFVVAVCKTVGGVFFCSLASFYFAKFQFPGRRFLFALCLVTMMIPPQVMIVSRFAIMQKAGLYNTHEGIILMLMFSTYGVFLLRQAMMGIPDSLCESAKIDGAGHLTIFFRVVFPLIKPSIATLAVLKFVWTWNDYQTPLIFINSNALYTIQLGMKMFANEMGSIYSLMMAAAVSSTIPLILAFILGQKYIIDGIASGAVKG